MRTFTRTPRRYVFHCMLTCKISSRRPSELFLFFTILDVIPISKICKVSTSHYISQNLLVRFTWTRNVRSLKAIKSQRNVTPKSLCTSKMPIFLLLSLFSNFQIVPPGSGARFVAKKRHKTVIKLRKLTLPLLDLSGA